MKDEKSKKPTAGAETRVPDWEAQVVTLNKEFAAHEASIAIQQEMLKAVAVQGKQWGLDLEKVTQMSRDAFDRLGRDIEGDVEQDAPGSNREAQ